MADRVVLHVGSMKTGTSYVQSALAGSTGALSRAGAAWPVPFGAQVAAVNDVLNTGRHPHGGPARWQRVAERVRACEQATAVLSMEFLSFARRRHVEAFLEPLRGLEVTVVITVRDQVAVLPAQWQSYTRNYGTLSWGDYLRAVRDAGPTPTSAHRKFHRAQGLRRIVGAWSAPGVGSVEVVTVPAPGAPRDELWRRFTAAAGIPAAGERAPGPATDDNESLGYASCDALRRVNAHLGDLSRAQYRAVVRPLSRRVLAPRRAGEGRPVPDAASGRWAVERNAAFRELIAGRGLRVHGDPDDLPVTAAAALPGATVPPEPAAVAAALDAVRSELARLVGSPGAPPVAEGDLDRLAADAGRMVRTLAGAASTG